MIYFTSDLHFGHDKEFMYQPRGFANIEDHDLTIVKNWNTIVSEDDTVYILGDLMLNDNEKGSYYFNQLNGHKVIICGNHDTQTRKDLYLDLKGVEGVYDVWQLDLNTELQKTFNIQCPRVVFWLCHYPTHTANFDDGKPWAKHVISIFGHTHQKDKFYNNNPYMYHVGLDSHNNYPVSIMDIIADIKAKKEELNNEMLGRIGLE